MRLRRISGPGLALFLAAGSAGVAGAQNVADPQGIMIRVDRPANDAWAGIGGRIEIRVLAYDGILDEGFRVSVADASVRDEDVGVTNGGAVSRGFVYYNIYIPDPRNLPPGVAFGDSGPSGIDTFRVSITVSPQAVPFQSEDRRSAKVVLDLDAASDGGELNNLMTEWKITPASTGFGAGRVGDGVRFGIDANRPVHGDVFESFSVETDALSVDTTRTGLIRRVGFGIGDEITVRFGLKTAGVLRAGASRVLAGVVETDSAFSTAPVTFEFWGDRLYRAQVRGSERVEKGDFGDNRRVRVEAYLADAAGNLGGASMDAQAASPVRAGHGLPDVFDPGGVEWIADASPPRITIVHPHPDSLEDRISAAVTQTLPDLKRLPWETDVVPAGRWLKPLEFRLSEVPDSIRITHGDSTHGIGSGAVDDPATFDLDEDMAPTGGDSTARPALPWKYDTAGGVRNHLTIQVWDSLGNTSSLTLPDIWVDEKAPVIGNLFPSEATAPGDPDNLDEPTINLASKDPVFTIDEELDSLSVRYVETAGATAVVQSFGPGNHRLETIGELVNWPVDNTGFYDRNRYELQILAVDLAGNASLTGGGAFMFSRGFLNPNAGAFRLVALTDRDVVAAGRDYSIRITALDTMLTRIEGAAVFATTYRAPVGLALIVPREQAAALEGVSFSGRGVGPAPSFPLPADLAAAGRVARAATLDGQGWRAGRRDVSVRSARPIAGAALMAAEYAVHPATGETTVRITGRLETALDVEAAEFSRFVVTAREGDAPAGTVSGAFTVNVLPADAFGNPSMKIDNVVGSETYGSAAVSFSSSHGAVKVPAGVQTVPAGGADFGAVAGDLDGTATITVRTVARDLVTGVGDSAVIGALTGSVTVEVAPEDSPGPAPPAPAWITVEDHRGADGRGDQGGWVRIGFPEPARRDGVVRYRIEREIETTLEGYDGDGREIHGETPVKRWMHWASITPGAVGGGVRRAVIPAPDNAATRWGVRSVVSHGGSNGAVAGKRMFSREPVRRTLRLLGIPSVPVLTDEEPMDRFNAPDDLVASVIGNRRDLVFVPVSPNAGALIGSASVPEHIRTATGGGLLVSARTVTETPVGAVDNIAPAAVTGATARRAGGAALQWTPSADDRIVGFVPFRGYNIPIPGVKGYRVMRGASADSLEKIAALPPGYTEFTDEVLPERATSLVYRIDAYDDSNVTPGKLIDVDAISARARFVDVNGDPVYLIVLPSRGGTPDFDFEDLVAFAAAFGSRRGDAGYNPQADVNDDGAVDFSDFATASATFGRTAVTPGGD